MWIAIIVLVILAVLALVFLRQTSSVKEENGLLPRLSYEDKKIETKVNNQVAQIETEFACHKNIPMEDLRFDYQQALEKEWRDSQGITDLTAQIDSEKDYELFELARNASKAEMEAKLAQFAKIKPETKVFKEKEVYSLNIKMFYDCQIYPLDYLSYVNLSSTFDLKTGGKVEFKELFNDFKKDQTSILAVIFANNEPVPTVEKSVAKDSSQEICEGSPTNFFNDDINTFTYHLSEKGLTVEHRSTAHGIRSACLNRATLPFSAFTRLSSYLSKDSILTRFLSN